FWTGRLFDRHGPAWSILPGGISWLIAYAIMSTADNIGVLLLAGFFSGIGMGALLPAMQTWCISRVGAERRSVASALYFNFYDIGIGIGAILVGFLFEIFGVRPTFLFASACMGVFLIVFLGSAAARTGKGGGGNASQ
ncbi:MAG: MFS transporter, partial [Clostridiales Family XIII bacterium]|nr:MFS transporter [Clostridiales Family XIII bacterium]